MKVAVDMGDAEKVGGMLGLWVAWGEGEGVAVEAGFGSVDQTNSPAPVTPTIAKIRATFLTMWFLVADSDVTAFPLGN